MGLIPDNIIDEIKQKADIIDVVGSFVELKHRNGEWWGCCPFHKEKTASFKVSQEHQAYYCFGCKAHGNLFTFVKQMVNTDFPGAARWLADRLNIDIPETGYVGSKEEADRRKKEREKRQSLLDLTAEWYHTQLKSPQAEVARNYLASRGLDQAAVEHFKLGYSPEGWDTLIKWALSMGFTIEDLQATCLVVTKEETGRIHDRFVGRLMFPIWNELGKVAGFSARVLDPLVKEQKYINSPESDYFHKRQLLYGFNFARSELKNFGNILICEGQLDVIACHRAGLVNAVASQGTAFTEEHIKLISKSTKNAVLSFDADNAGNKAAAASINLLHAAGFDVSVVTLPNGEDPDSVFKKGGGEALRQIMSNTEPAINYLFKVASANNNIRTAEGLSIAVRYVLDAISPITDLVKRVAYCKWLASQVGLDEQVILREFEDIELAKNKKRQFGTNTQYAGPQQYQSAQQVHQATPYMPVNYIQSPDTQLWYLMFDLILHYEQLAQSFSYMDDVIIAVPPTPLGQALNYAAIYTQQDEWKTLSETLMNMDIFEDADVARAIVASDIKTFSPAGTEIPQNIQKSFDDCIARIRLIAITKLIDVKRAECKSSLDVDRQRQLFAEINELSNQKRVLSAQLKKL